MTKILQKLIIVHLTLVTFSLFLRSVVINLPIYRDSIIILLAVIGLSYRYISTNSISKASNYYILYGLFYIILWGISGEDVYNLIKDFRNHFFPFVLCHVTYYSISKENQFNGLLKFIRIIFYVLCTCRKTFVI